MSTHVAEKEGTRENQLQLAGKAGVARELFEETGIYIRSQLDRFVPAKLRVIAKHNKDGIIVLANEYKHRLFYFLIVTDDDFAKQGVGAMGTDIVNSSCAHIKVSQSLFVQHHVTKRSPHLTLGPPCDCFPSCYFDPID